MTFNNTLFCQKRSIRIIEEINSNFQKKIVSEVFKCMVTNNPLNDQNFLLRSHDKELRLLLLITSRDILMLLILILHTEKGVFFLLACASVFNLLYMKLSIILIILTHIKQELVRVMQQHSELVLFRFSWDKICNIPFFCSIFSIHNLTCIYISSRFLPPV